MPKIKCTCPCHDNPAHEHYPDMMGHKRPCCEGGYREIPWIPEQSKPITASDWEKADNVIREMMMKDTFFSLGPITYSEVISKIAEAIAEERNRVEARMLERDRAAAIRFGHAISRMGWRFIDSDKWYNPEISVIGNPTTEELYDWIYLKKKPNR